MAYTGLATAVTGDLWTAANHNTYIKDNFAAGVPDIFTTAGDLPYATAANTADVLAIGEARKVLMVNSGATAPEWHTMFFGCNLACTTDLTLTNNINTIVPFDTEIYDTSNFWDDTDTDEVLIPWDGIYQVTGVFTVGQFGDSNGTVYAFVGTNWALGSVLGSTDGDPTFNFCFINRFTAGSDIYMSVLQASTGDNTLKSAYYSVTYLGAST